MRTGKFELPATAGEMVESVIVIGTPEVALWAKVEKIVATL
jgi:hypothetical protein